MELKELRNLVTQYNSKENRICDDQVSFFISNIYREFQRIFAKGDWGEFLGAKTIGITIDRINATLKVTDFRITRFLRRTDGKMIDVYNELVDFDDYFKNDFSHDLSGFESKDVFVLIPFVESLKRNGFEVYVDTGDIDYLVVAFTI